jgi:uncharacterized LabA/DUF88 family protein
MNNKMARKNQSKAYAFIDASNLFYGGEKSLGWKIDYKKLLEYLKIKYGVKKAFYFGGVETHGYAYDFLIQESVPLEELQKYLVSLLTSQLSADELSLIKSHTGRVGFYERLESFGYHLFLKPVKQYKQEDGTIRRKANCDVDMTFHMMKDVAKYENAVVLTGDGDYLPVLKYLKAQSKRVYILARGPRTAREIRKFAGSNFRDFVTLRKAVEYKK